MGQRADPIQPERLLASGPARGPRRDTHNRPTPGNWPILRTIHAVCRYPRKETRSPAHAAGSRMHHFRRAPPASTCSSVALAPGGIRCRSAVPARLPGERAPGSPRVPESNPASSRPAGPRNPEGLPREVSRATRLAAPLSGPAPLSLPPRRRSRLPRTNLPSPQRLGVALPVLPPFPAPVSPARGCRG